MTLPPEALRQLTVARAQAVYHEARARYLARRPELDRELRALERRPVVVVVMPVAADFGGQE